jgi:peroxiredoxin Q/BCP
MALNIGDTAPDFMLSDASGQQYDFARATGANGLVVFFYPKDGTPLCVREACAFRDSLGEFHAHGFNVVGVSSDPPDSHSRFAQENGLAYPLLSDTRGLMRKRWGVPSTMGVLPGRVTYVLDRDARVLAVFSSQLEPGQHVEEALNAIKKLA